MRLTEAVRELQVAASIPSAILPMTDTPVRTHIRIDGGWIDFQEYFVHRQQAPEVLEVRFAGIDDARPTDEVLDALARADVVVIGPSNPIVSVGPILALPGLHAALAEARQHCVPFVAVSPIIGGQALKGPAGRMLTSLGFESSALGVARLYADVATTFVLDEQDAALVSAIEALGLRAVATDTIMADEAGRARVARSVLEGSAR